MPSPFPGMDPFLENPAFWEDFHDRFLTYWSDALNEVLPDGYEARVKERVQISDDVAGVARVAVPDVAVLAAPDTAPAWAAQAPVATLEPVTLPILYLEEGRTTFLEVRRGPEREVVSVLELLSPANTAGSNRTVYLQERETLLHQDVHLFELDLLRGGARLPVGGALPGGDYYAVLSRVETRPNCEVFAWSLRDRLPRLPIPLRAPDLDVLIDFQEVFDVAYDRGRYARPMSREAGRDTGLHGHEGPAQRSP